MKPLLIIKAFYCDGELPFICFVHGNVTTDVLFDLENQLREDMKDLFTKGDGVYRFSCYYEQPQFNEFGRVEIKAYWAFSLKSFRRIKL